MKGKAVPKGGSVEAKGSFAIELSVGAGDLEEILLLWRREKYDLNQLSTVLVSESP